MKEACNVNPPSFWYVSWIPNIIELRPWNQIGPALWLTSPPRVKYGRNGSFAIGDNSVCQSRGTWLLGYIKDKPILHNSLGMSQGMQLALLCVDVFHALLAFHLDDGRFDRPAFIPFLILHCRFSTSVRDGEGTGKTFWSEIGASMAGALVGLPKILIFDPLSLFIYHRR